MFQRIAKCQILVTYFCNFKTIDLKTCYCDGTYFAANLFLIRNEEILLPAEDRMILNFI